MNDMDFSRFKGMPDSVEPAEAEMCFREILSMEKPLDTRAVLRMAEALDEVSDRQWHTFTRLCPELRNTLENWIEANWDTSSLPLTQLIMSIIGKVGLPRAAELAKQTLAKHLSSSIRQEIESALAEYGASVDDPYSGMRK